MSSAFVPFATGFAVAGAADAARRKVEYGTGVFVSATGHVLTDRRLIDGCNVIALPGLGNAERVATDSERRARAAAASMARATSTPLGMIGARAGRRERHAGRRRRSAGAGRRRGDLERSTPSLAPRPRRSPLETAPAPGFSGAAALDAQGRFAGMVVVKVAGGRGPGRRRRGPPWCRPSGSGISSRPITSRRRPAPPGVEAAKASVTRVICVRK